MATPCFGFPRESEMTLYTLSLIRVSVNFWELPEIKENIKDFFSDNNNERNFNSWQKIVKEVFNIIDNFDGLVMTIVPDLKEAVQKTGIDLYRRLSELDPELSFFSVEQKKLWMPLGFHHEKRVWKWFWENFAFYLEDKQRFRLACMSAEEEYIEKHQSNMIEDLKTLLYETYYNNIDVLIRIILEFNDYPDKVYRIISIYLSYYITVYFNKRSIRNKSSRLDALIILHRKKLSELVHEMNKLYDDQEAIVETLTRVVSHGSVALPDLMVKLCVISNLPLAVKYYYEKLNGPQKDDAKSWIRNYCELKLIVKNGSYEAGKLREILGAIDDFDP